MQPCATQPGDPPRERCSAGFAPALRSRAGAKEASPVIVPVSAFGGPDLEIGIGTASPGPDLETEIGAENLGLAA